MRLADSELILSATDLASFFECAHKTALDVQVAHGHMQRPGQSEIERRMLERRGREHEARVLDYYRALDYHGNGGLVPFDVGAQPATAQSTGDLAALTLSAMQRGEPLIYQGVLVKEGWVGRPDFLLRVERPSSLGKHGYEPVDAKLARSEKARAILQLCVYAELLEHVQGATPEHLWLALGSTTIEPIALRSEKFLAYYRQSKARLSAFLGGEAPTPSPAEPYPEPCEHCDVCDWWRRCEERRRKDDHLSLVAGITRRQRTRLELVGVSQLARLAALPSEQPIDGIDAGPLARVREQARVQQRGRSEGRVVYELLADAEAGTGLEALPEPRPGDLFLDIEGDAFVGDGGLEYLFGLLELGQPEFDFVEREERGAPHYLAFWATNPEEEKRAFEQVMARIKHGLTEFPDLHVFHFGVRENVALKKLSCKYGTHEATVDHLLRNGLLVDLHAVVKQSLRASVEAYTLKDLEPLHGFQRSVDKRTSARAMQYFGWWLETRDPEIDVDELRKTLAQYNAEDCTSTWKLQDWLEGRRAQLAQVTGRQPARPGVEEDKAREPGEREKNINRVRERLLAGLPSEQPHEPAAYAAQRLLADLLGWHWRENKSGYWEYFEAKAVPPTEWLESHLILAELTYEGVCGQVKRSELHRYTFPEQEHPIRRRGRVEIAGSEGTSVEVVDIGPDSVVIKRGKRANIEHPTALRAAAPLEAKHQEERLLAIAEAIISHGFEAAPYQAAKQLLTRSAPSCGQAPGEVLIEASEDVVEAVKRLCLALEGSVLPIQGPPGAGKTYCAKEAILALVQAGKKVGVTANSHQVILGVLKKVHDSAVAAGLPVHIQHIGKADEYQDDDLPFPVDEHERVLARLQAGEAQVVGGTAFAWTRPEFARSVDVLFVDEAGQMSLANAVAVSAAADSLVLVGDPAQLDQPQKGVHPQAAEASALAHFLGTAATMPAHLGVFLPQTRRLHPAICAFTSAMFYDGKLRPLPGLELQRINAAPSAHGSSPFDGAGLRYVPVCHAGNRNRSDEEVEQVERIVKELLSGSTTFSTRNQDGALVTRPLTSADVLVIAPYNAQVAALRHRLPANVAVGTVDKFQGKEAPVVIFSMTTSSGDDAPRGLEFLYSLNRLNVATSRAQALVILVASPELTNVRCRTPRQLVLVNALCRFIEEAGRG